MNASFVRSALRTGLVVAVVFGAQVARAQIVIVSNLTEPPAGTDGNTLVTAAQQFFTDGTALDLASVTLALRGTSADTLDVSLFTDAAGLPGTSLLSLGTAVPTSSVSFNDITLIPGSSFTLAANTPYWIVGHYNGNTSWGFTNSSTYTGVGSLGSLSNSTTGGAPWRGPYTGEPYMLEVVGAAATPAVPEPGSLALLMGCGLTGGLNLLRARRLRM